MGFEGYLIGERPMPPEPDPEPDQDQVERLAISMAANRDRDLAVDALHDLAFSAEADKRLADKVAEALFQWVAGNKQQAAAQMMELMWDAAINAAPELVEIEHG